jgi:hypothetical protein
MKKDTLITRREFIRSGMRYVLLGAIVLLPVLMKRKKERLLCPETDRFLENNACMECARQRTCTVPKEKLE